MMTAFTNRVGRLERASLEAGIARARMPVEMTDQELWHVMLEDQGIISTDETVAEHMRHFDLTGELPGGLHTIVAERQERKERN